MGMPTLTDSGQRLYDALAPLATQDASNNYALANYCNALAKMLDPVATVVRDQDDGTPGWAFPFQLSNSWTVVAENLILNPSFEHDGVGSAPAAWSTSNSFVSSGAVPTVIGTNSQSGSKSLQVVTTTPGEGVTISLPGTFKAGVTYTASIWLTGVSGNPAVSMMFGDDSGSLDYNFTSQFTLVNGAAWKKYSLMWTPGADRTSVSFAVKSGGLANYTWLMDTGMAGLTSTYFDGDSADCYWSSTAGNSISLQYTPTDHALWLPWLAQIVGVDLTAVPNIPEQVSLIEQPTGQQRGTVAAMQTVAKTTLTGTKTCLIYERTNGNAWTMNAYTYTTETADPTATLTALMSMKPAGVILTYSTVIGGTYSQLAASHATYSAMEAAHSTYTDIPNNPGA